jgi:Tfp pilus assembly protein PilF
MEKIRIFVSYARKDREFLDRLLVHLAPLVSEGVIAPWTDLGIDPGDHWDEKIAAELDRAQIVLLLISADFLASRYISAVELKRALERERRGEIVVIPVILNFVDWGTSPFHHLQALPANAKPITRWHNRDEAYVDVALGVRRVISKLQTGPLPEPAAAEGETVWQDRVLDAAMAARIPLGKPSDLAVMVRLAGSAGLKAVLESDDEFTSQPENVKSKPFQMEFGHDAHGKLKAEVLKVEIESPDFDPPSQSEEIAVPPDRDSDVTTFLLRPLFPGELVIKLKVFARDGRNAIRLLRIFSEASDRVIVDGRVLVSMPITAVAGEQRAVAAAAAPAAAVPPSAPSPLPQGVDTGEFPVPPASFPVPPPAAAPAARKRSWILPSAGAAGGLVAALVISVVFITPKGAIHPPVESVALVVDAPPIPVAAAAPSGSSEQPSGVAVTKNLKLAAKATSAEREKYLSAAVEGANKGVQLQPNSAAAQYLRGVALERSEQFGAAESAFREASRLDPKDAKSWYGLGVALQKQNRTDDAARALEKAVQLDPSNADARLLLAATLAKAHPAKAREHVQILTQDPSLPAPKAAALRNLRKSLNTQ